MLWDIKSGLSTCYSESPYHLTQFPHIYRIAGKPHLSHSLHYFPRNRAPTSPGQFIYKQSLAILASQISSKHYFPMARLRQLQITIFLAMLSAFVEAENLQMNSRKLDESPPDLNKCGNCPCDSPCNPPPSPPPPSPPPPPNNPPPSYYCPPPPAPSGGKPAPFPPYIIINGPPGSVYPVYPYYSGQARSFSMGIIPFLISSILWVLAF